jgi:hypothetical protein
MTIRTASLLMLFVVAFGASAVLLAAIQPMAMRLDVSTPWLAPAIAVVCYSATLFWGRRYILPYQIAISAPQAWMTLVVLTVGSMALVYGVVWLARRYVVVIPGAAVAALWFTALWVAVQALHRTTRPSRMPVR